jgi:hypothetical protein
MIEELITIYARPEWFPADDEPEGVLFLDKPNRANSLVRPLLLDLVLNGRVGPLRQLPPKWFIIAACNPSDSGNYDVSELDDAMLDRMVHLSVSMTVSDWVEGFARKVGIHEDIIDTVMGDETVLGVKDCSIPPAPDRRPRDAGDLPARGVRAGGGPDPGETVGWRWVRTPRESCPRRRTTGYFPSLGSRRDGGRGCRVGPREGRPGSDRLSVLP